MSKLDFGLDILDTDHNHEISFPTAFETVRRTYGVLLSFEDEKKEKLQIHYEMEIICLEKIDDNNFVFELQKNQVFVNEKVPDTTMDQLIERCGNVLYPLQLQVNRFGQALEVLNHEQIKHRWTAERRKIERSYSGEVTKTLLINMDDSLSNSRNILSSVVEQDWFMTLFFTPVYGALSRKEKSQVIALPMLPYATPIPFEINEDVNNNKRNQNIIITRKGKCVEKRSEAEIRMDEKAQLHKGGKFQKGTVNLTYHIYSGSPILDAIIGNCTLEFPSGKSNKVTMEIYNLKRKVPMTAIEKKAVLEETKKAEPQPKKKKKKYFLFGKEIKLS